MNSAAKEHNHFLEYAKIYKLESGVKILAALPEKNILST
jgi:hypothetical protein